jgi:hypothetical protein
MKLACSSPWRSRSASHSLSWTSVLRPGTVLRCWGLTSRICRPASSRWYMGFQYTPVDSIARTPTARPRSQSERASNSAVIVPHVCTSRSPVPSGCVTRTQATTVRLCTSNPQQRSYTTCIAWPLSDLRSARAPWASSGCDVNNKFLPRAHLPAGEGRHSSAPGRTRVSFALRAHDTTTPATSCCWSLPLSLPGACRHFHPHRCRARATCALRLKIGSEATA